MKRLGWLGLMLAMAATLTACGDNVLISGTAPKQIQVGDRTVWCVLFNGNAITCDWEAAR